MRVWEQLKSVRENIPFKFDTWPVPFGEDCEREQAEEATRTVIHLLENKELQFLPKQLLDKLKQWFFYDL